MHCFLHVPAMIKCSKMKIKDESIDNRPSRERCNQFGGVFDP